MSEIRTIFLSADPSVAGFLWFHGYDRLKHDLTTATAKFGVQPSSISATDPPSVWRAMESYDMRDSSVPIGEIRCGILVGNGGHGSGDGFVTGEFWGWLLPTDAPEVEPINCGRFRVA